MAKREVNFPHTIGFRLSDEAWFRIEQEVVNTHLTPHDWCRKVVLKTLDEDYGLSKHERLLFYQLVRTQALVAQGFQMLADDTLRPEEWKKYRAYANEKTDYFVDSVLKEFRQRIEIRGKK